MSSCFWFVTFLKITPRMSFPISKRLTFLDYFSYMQFSRYILAPLVCRSHSLRLASSCLGSVSQTPCGIFVTELFFMLLKIPDWCFISHQKTELFCSTLWSPVKPVIFLIWQPPALPHRLQCSTIGRSGLNRRVQDGNGCVPRAHRRQKYSLSSCKCGF